MLCGFLQKSHGQAHHDVTGEDGYGVVPFHVNRWPPASQCRSIHDIVVDKRKRVQQFHGHSSRDGMVKGSTTGFGGKRYQKGTNALPSSIK
jgi:hypothetical protein